MPASTGINMWWCARTVLNGAVSEQDVEDAAEWINAFRVLSVYDSSIVAPLQNKDGRAALLLLGIAGLRSRFERRKRPGKDGGCSAVGMDCKTETAQLVWRRRCGEVRGQGTHGAEPGQRKADAVAEPGPRNAVAAPSASGL